jgi:hypothetical protein
MAMQSIEPVSLLDAQPGEEVRRLPGAYRLASRPGNISAAMRVEYTASMASPNHDSPAIETEDN